MPNTPTTLPDGSVVNTSSSGTVPANTPHRELLAEQNVANLATGLNAAAATRALHDLATTVADPGASGAIPATSSGHVELVTATAETRTLAAPAFNGQQLLVSLKTDGGDAVLTVATTVNQTGNNTVTFNDAGDAVLLVAKQSGANLRWAVAMNDGAALSTVA